MERAVSTPEIVAQIVENFHKDKPYPDLHSKPLHSCLLVNRLWYNESVRLLWETVNDRELYYVEDPKRQQFYAHRVRELRVHGEFKEYRFHTTTSFAGGTLKRLRLSGGPLHVERFQKFLVPSVEWLELKGALVCSVKFLNDVRDKCPSVSQLVLNDNRSVAPPLDSIRDLVASMQLTHLDLQSSGVNTTDIVGVACHKPSIVHLAFTRLTPAMLPGILVGNTLVNLQSLHLSEVDSCEGLLTFLRHTPNLKTLLVLMLGEGTEPCNGLVKTIAQSCMRLQTLALNVTRNYQTLLIDMVYAAQKLDQLRELHIYYTGVGSSVNTCRLLKSLAYYARNLQVLSLALGALGGENDYKFENILALGQYCRNLRQLSLSNVSVIEYDLDRVDQVMHGAPLFPCLVEMSPSPSRKAVEDDIFLKRNFPRLRRDWF